MRWFGAWLALVTTTMSACLISTSGLSGGSRGGGAGTPSAPDANTPVVEAGVSDAADADAGPFCASLSPAPAFCADFDESANIDAGFVFLAQGGHGEQLLDDATFTSAGHSL